MDRMHKIKCIALVVLVLPVLLHVFNPSMELGGLGLLLGAIGMTLSPLLILYLLWYYVRREWQG